MGGGYQTFLFNCGNNFGRIQGVYNGGSTNPNGLTNSDVFISCNYNQQTGVRDGALIGVAQVQLVSGNAADGKIIFRTSPNGSGTLTSVPARMTVTSTGVGIGTTNPQNTLHVSGGRTRLVAGSETYALGVSYSEASGGLYYIGATNSATPDMVFSQGGGSERMRITNVGNVGIGTTNPGYLLDVSSFAVDGGTIRIASSSSCQFRMMEVNDTYGFSFTNVAASRMSIKRHSASQAGTEVISIMRDSSAVGIGTTNPAALLTCAAAYTNGGTHAEETGAKILLGANNQSGPYGVAIQCRVPANSTVNESDMQFSTCDNSGNQLVRVTIKGTSNPVGGNVGIGTTNPGYTLDVNGTVNLTGVRITGTVGGNSTGYGAYLRAAGTAGNVGWGAINEYYYSAGTIPSSSWTNIVAQSTLGTAGIKNAFVHIRMFGGWWGTIQTIVDSGYVGYPNFVSNSPCYQSGFEVRFSGGYLQILQNSGGNAGMDIVITKIGW
jgi:hypothetical protein